MSNKLHKILNELVSVPNHRKAAAVINAEEIIAEAYRNGYNDNARDCLCTGGTIPHKHLIDDGDSHDIRPNIEKLLKKEEV